MDKGLKILEELEKKSEELGIQRDDIEAKMQELIYTGVVSMNTDISNQKYALEKLNKEKEFAEKAPEECKKETKRFKRMFIWITIISVFFISASSGSIDLANLVFNLQKILFSTLICGGFSSVWAYFFIKDTKSRYKTREISEIDKDIQEKNEELETTISKQNEIHNQIKDYEKLRANILSEFYETNNQISAMEELRAQVMEEFCKDNLELHALLNNAYDEKFEEENNQKVKK